MSIDKSKSYEVSSIISNWFSCSNSPRRFEVGALKFNTLHGYKLSQVHKEISINDDSPILCEDSQLIFKSIKPHTIEAGLVNVLNFIPNLIDVPLN